MKEELISANVERIVTFDLLETEFAIPISHIQEIYNVGNLLPVPLAPLFLNSIVNIRGNIITVFDLSTFLLSQKTVTNEESRIILIDNSELKIGILVKMIYQIEYISKDSIEELKQEEKEDTLFTLTRNIFRSDYTGRTIHILDCKKIIQLLLHYDCEDVENYDR